MLIYRLEHTLFRGGPYVIYEMNYLSDSNFDLHKLLEEIINHPIHNDSAHPNMFEDTLAKRRLKILQRREPEATDLDPKYLFCGCISEEKLISWFGSYWNQLLANDFVMRVYDCPEEYAFTGAHRSGQVVFLRNRSKLLQNP